LVVAGPEPARPLDDATAEDASPAHDVSILMAAGVAVGLWRGSSPALNTSMMCMAEPQHGHGVAGVLAQGHTRRQIAARIGACEFFPCEDP
jgi:hypothetical protein